MDTLPEKFSWHWLPHSAHCSLLCFRVADHSLPVVMADCWYCQYYWYCRPHKIVQQSTSPLRPLVDSRLLSIPAPFWEKRSKKNKKIWEQLFSKIWKFRKRNNFCQKKAILLVLPIEEISLWPELSSPSKFIFHWGWSERDGEGRKRTEIFVSNIGFLWRF